MWRDIRREKVEEKKNKKFYTKTLIETGDK